MTQSKYRNDIKFVLFGLQVIGFVIGYGAMYLFAVVGISQFYEVNNINSHEFPYNILVPTIPVIGVLILVYWVFDVARTKKCPHCNGVLIFP